MASAVAAHPRLQVRTAIAIGTHREADLPADVDWYESAHPIPDARSVAAAQRALQTARSVGADEGLLLLLSGGASALMALPVEGLDFEDKQTAIRTMMLAGADIEALNTVRKHLSAIKGGRLAAACRGTTLTLAISDVVGDDLSVIGSGPAVADPTTWSDAARALDRFGRHGAAVRDVIARGVRGELADTPKPGAAVMSNASSAVIASRRDALIAASDAARALGYQPIVVDEPITGEARAVAPRWFDVAMQRAANVSGPVCVLSAGETTVRVVGQGRGGRNQEFVLALSDRVADDPADVVVASAGTDGIDGPTDAAGALVDRTTRARATTFGLDPRAILADNNAYDFFALLGDLIHLGRTDTNVGDVQVLLK